ncbi:hypothetical protein HGRIS_011149 [Hohenbuehelia grisea]|uniref:Uncharacterized protein n=1 Tax=Hohenbuehelia grisea TaxID=104357 RepID=A0ABR3IZ45_9AGAR
MSVAKYRMRASPAAGVGGMYATSHGENKPVTTAALGLNIQGDVLQESQLWATLPGDITMDKYRVCLYDPSTNFSLGLGVPEKLVPGEPMILTTEEHQVVWYLQPFDVPGVGKAYTLRPDVEVMGAKWFAGTNRDGQIVVKALLLNAPKEDIPYWVLERENDA